MSTPGRECSSVKSSTKVSLLARVPSGLISEGLALSACPTGLNECRLLFRLADRRSLPSHFLRRFIATPVVRLRTWKMLVWSEAWNAEGEKGKTGCHFNHTPTTTHVPTALPFMVLSSVPKRNQQGILEGNAADHASWMPATPARSRQERIELNGR